MLSELDLQSVKSFGVALAIGALVGLEREKRKAVADSVGIGGLRTFIIVALLGAISGWYSELLGNPWPVVASLVIVGAGVLVGYVLRVQRRPQALGLTTEFAAVAVCLLGAMTLTGHIALAALLGIVIAAVLAYKQPLHGIVERIGWDDIFAGLRLLAASFVILPLLPNETIDSLGVINPHKLWLIVVFISALSFAGYLAIRWLGSGRGTVMVGLSGGLVSSTAVTLEFSRRSRNETTSYVANALVTGTLLSWSVSLLRVVVLLIIVNEALGRAIAIPLVAMSSVVGVSALLYIRRTIQGAKDVERTEGEVPLQNPFSLTAAIKFAVFLTFVQYCVAVAQRILPLSGMYVVAALAGATDTDAIALSMADYARHGDIWVATRCVILAIITNTIVKCLFGVLWGSPTFKKGLMWGTLVLVAVATGFVLY